MVVGVESVQTAGVHGGSVNKLPVSEKIKRSKAYYHFCMFKLKLICLLRKAEAKIKQRSKG